MIQAEIRGHYGNYRVWPSRDEDEFLEPFCSCPADMHFCKHAAAIGVTWIHEPDTFFNSESLPEMLAEKSKPEVGEIILRMVQLYPGCLTVLGVEGFEDEDEYDEDEAWH